MKREFLRALQRSSEMGFLDLFVVAVVPVLKVLLITLVGLFLALDRIDLLGSTARPYLNNVSSIHVYRILYMFYRILCVPSHHNRQILCVCAAYILCVQSSARV